MNLRRKPSKRTVSRVPGGAPPAKYYQSEKTASSPFRKNDASSRKGRWAGMAMDIVIIATIAGLLAYSLFVTPNPEVVVNDESYHSARIYEEAVKTEINKLTNRTKLTFNEEQISASLIKQFPEITDVKTSLPLIGQKPKVKIEIGQPALRLESAGELYVVNDQGVVIGPAGKFKSSDSLPTLKDDSGFEIITGRSVLQSSSVSFIELLKAQLDKSQIPLESISLPPRAQELNLRTADRSYYVKFFLGGSVTGQIGQYLATRQQMDEDNASASEYMDVRVPGKVFYK